MNKLLQKGIETRSFFYPMHKQKIIKKLKILKTKSVFHNAEELNNNGFYLPSGIGIKNEEIKIVCRELNKIIR